MEPRLVMDVNSTQTPKVNSREAQNCDAKEKQLRFKRKITDNRIASFFKWKVPDGVKHRH